MKMNKEEESQLIKFVKKEVEFPTLGSEKLKLKGTLFLPEGKDPFPGVIFYHGSGSSRIGFLPIGEELAQNEIANLAFDFRGCGQSPEELSGLCLSEREFDAHSALHFLINQAKVDEKRIGISGSSMGAPQTVLMAALHKDSVSSLLLRAPAAYSDFYSGERFGTYKQTYERGGAWKNSITFTYLTRFKGDILIVESENDEIIPHYVVKRYLDNAKKARTRELHVIKGATHNLGEADSPFRQEFNKVAANWFLRTLQGSG